MKPVAANASNVHNSHSNWSQTHKIIEDEGLKERKHKQINRERRQWIRQFRISGGISNSQTNKLPRIASTIASIKGAPNLANIYRITCSHIFVQQDENIFFSKLKKKDDLVMQISIASMLLRGSRYMLV
jgi:hypothetical protein